MICAHCLKFPIACGLPHAAKSVWNGFTRAWRAALGTLGQLG